MNSNSRGRVVIISSNGTQEILGEAGLRRATDNYYDRGHVPFGGALLINGMVSIMSLVVVFSGTKS